MGASEGKPGEVMRISETPMLPLGDGEWVEVSHEDNTGWERWQQVSNISHYFDADTAPKELLPWLAQLAESPTPDHEVYETGSYTNLILFMRRD